MMRIFCGLSVAALAGCAAVDRQIESVNDRANAQRSEIKDIRAQQMAGRSEVNRVIMVNRPFVPAVTSRYKEAHPWLEKKSFSFRPASAGTGIPLTELLKEFSSQGLNITTAMDISQYTYAGFPLYNMSAENALKALLTPVGLSYTIDDANQRVIITGLPRKIWHIDTPNQSVSFSLSADSNISSSFTPVSSGSNGSSGSTSAANATTTPVGSAGDFGVKYGTDFWKSLDTELKTRLQMGVYPANSPTSQQSNAMMASAGSGLTGMPPVPGQGVGVSPYSLQQGVPFAYAQGAIVGNMQPTMPIAAAASQTGSALSGGTGLKTIPIGTYTLNPDTGTVIVQAPQWLLDDIDDYIAKIQSSLRTRIEFAGKIIVVSVANDKQSGFDLNGFLQYANGLGIHWQNQAAGGVVLSAPSGTSIINAPQINVPVPQTSLMGLSLIKNGGAMSLFNAYLDTVKNYRILQEPTVSAKSGTPVAFSNNTTFFVQQITQQAVAGGASGGAATATNNTFSPIKVGFDLRMFPTYDPDTGLIQVPVKFSQSTKTSEQVYNQQLTNGSEIRSVPTTMPNLSNAVYSSASVMRNGDLLILGGHTEEVDTVTEDGIGGTLDSIISPFTGRKNVQRTKLQYLIALEARVVPE